MFPSQNQFGKFNIDYLNIKLVSKPQTAEESDSFYLPPEES
jgi:hypothetical protein